MLEAHDGLTVREYARQENITIQTAYRRIWDGAVEAKQVLGRWLILSPDTQKQTVGAA